MSSTDTHNMPFQGIRTNPADNRSSMTFSASVTMPFVWSFLTCQTQAEPFEEWMREDQLQIGNCLLHRENWLCGGPPGPEWLMAGRATTPKARCWPVWTPCWLPAGAPFPEGCPSPGRQGRWVLTAPGCSLWEDFQVPTGPASPRDAWWRAASCPPGGPTANAQEFPRCKNPSSSQTGTTLVFLWLQNSLWDQAVLSQHLNHIFTLLSPSPILLPVHPIRLLSWEHQFRLVSDMVWRKGDVSFTVIISIHHTGIS